MKDHHKLLTGITISVGDEGTSQRAVSSEVDVYELFDGRGPDGMREAMLLSESITSGMRAHSPYTKSSAGPPWTVHRMGIGSSPFSLYGTKPWGSVSIVRL